MTRKMYENEHSLANEAAFKARYEKHYPHKLKKMPIKYHIDYAVLERNENYREFKTVGFIEFRKRTINRLDFPTYMISLFKMQTSKRLYEDTGKKTLLWIEWKDTSGWCVLNTVPFDLRWNDVTNRNDEQDKEPMAHIPIEEFILSKWEPSKI